MLSQGGANLHINAEPVPLQHFSTSRNIVTALYKLSFSASPVFLATLAMSDDHDSQSTSNTSPGPTGNHKTTQKNPGRLPPTTTSPAPILPPGNLNGNILPSTPQANPAENQSPGLSPPTLKHPMMTPWQPHPPQKLSLHTLVPYRAPNPKILTATLPTAPP